MLTSTHGTKGGGLRGRRGRRHRHPEPPHRLNAGPGACTRSATRPGRGRGRPRVPSSSSPPVPVGLLRRCRRRRPDKHVAGGAYDSGVRPHRPSPAGSARSSTTPSLFHFGMHAHRRGQRPGGGGPGPACFADLRFAALDAKLTTALGRPACPRNTAVLVLPRLVGWPRDRPVAVEPGHCRRRGRAHGPVNWAVPGDELPLPHLRLRRGAWPRRSAEATAVAKRQIYTDLHGDVAPPWTGAERLLSDMVTRPDFAEGGRR